MEFSEQVKYVRKRLGLTQRRLAELLGVDCGTVNRWENTHTEPNYKAIRCFIDFCDLKGIEFPLEN